MSEKIVAYDGHMEHWYTGEEIVRCRDCVHRRRYWNGHAPNFTADFFCAYTGGHEVEPDGFCAWGEIAKRYEELRS